MVKIIDKIILDVRTRPKFWITMVLAVVGAMFSSDASAMFRGLGFFLWLFRTKSGLIPAFSKAGYSPYLSMDIYTHGYHTYVSG